MSEANDRKDQITTMNEISAMRGQTTRRGLWLAALGIVALVPAMATAQSAAPDSATNGPFGMGITQKLGDYVPKDATFKNEDGKTVHFGDMLQGRPVVLVPIFYACKTGCSALVEQVIQTLARANSTRSPQHKMVVGKDLDILMVSINPKETPELAHNKKNFFIDAFEPPSPTAEWRATTENGWHLLTGNLTEIHKVTDAIGFKYSYDEKKDLIQHPTCTVVLSPQGRISGYTIGMEFPTRVVQEDIDIAAQNKVAEPADQSSMFGCIMLDPVTGKRRIVIENVLRLASLLTLLVLGGSIVSMSLKTKRAERLRDEKNDDDGAHS